MLRKYTWGLDLSGLSGGVSRPVPGPVHGAGGIGGLLAWVETSGQLAGSGINGAVGESGLGYWGYRYYSPRLGRWLNRDPIGEKGGAASIKQQSSFLNQINQIARVIAIIEEEFGVLNARERKAIREIILDFAPGWTNLLSRPRCA